jgi:hypothetical protein
MNRLLKVTAIFEAATGLALIIVPSLVAQLLLGTELSGVAIVVARVAGVGLFSLGVACWPIEEGTRAQLCAMLTYDVLVTFYLLYVAIGGEWIGVLLWPAIVLHGVLTLLLARQWFKQQKNRSA